MSVLVTYATAIVFPLAVVVLLIRWLALYILPQDAENRIRWIRELMKVIWMESNVMLSHGYRN